MEVAHRTDARLVGVDYSKVAIRLATEQAAVLGREAEFRVGDLTATGLADASVDAVMCIDAIHFARPPTAAYRELHRVLKPGGRAVLTCWEATDPNDESAPREFRELDLRGGLTAAGFSHVAVLERPEWLEAELAMWAEAPLSTRAGTRLFGLCMTKPWRCCRASTQAEGSSPWAQLRAIGELIRCTAAEWLTDMSATP